MQIKLCNNKMWKVKSEEGFTLLELIFVSAITGIISSTLILPFASSMNQATHPEIYNTATYLAVEVMEEYRSNGYSSIVTSSNLMMGDPINPARDDITKKGRDYSLVINAGYVDDPSDTSLDTVTATEYIRVQVTVGNADIPDDVVLWEILAADFYNPNPNAN